MDYRGVNEKNIDSTVSIWQKALLLPFIATECKVNNTLPNLTTELKPNIAIETHLPQAYKNR